MIIYMCIEDKGFTKIERNYFYRKGLIMKSSTSKLVLTGLMAAMVTVTTMFIKIPMPATSGYVHPGDAAIFLSVLILGKYWGGAAAGIGSAMGDILGGYGAWAPWTLVIKTIMGFATGLVLEVVAKKMGDKFQGSIVVAARIGAMIVGGLIMVGGYYVAAAIIYGSWIVPIESIPGNIGQFTAGIVIAMALAIALERTPAKTLLGNHQ